MVGIAPVVDSDSLLLVSSGGKMIRLFVKDVSIIGRNTGGVRLMKLDDGEKVVALEKVAADADDGSGNGNGEESKGEPPKPPAAPQEPQAQQKEAEGAKAKGKKEAKEKKDAPEPIIIA